MSSSTHILETDRLQLMLLTSEAAPFILTLLNDPAWLQHIGDRGVITLQDAEDYILEGPVHSYKQHGFGLYLTQLKENCTPIGLCGLLKRTYLPYADIGFAFLPEYRRKGYAYEAASAVLHFGNNNLGLKTLLALVSPENHASIRLLIKLGMNYKKTINLEDGTVCQLFSQKKR